jgi:plasmid stabilization system protein ParE
VSGYRITTQAEDDIVEIASYIAADNPRAADRFVSDAYDTFDLLARRPRMGHTRRDLTSLPVLFWPLRKRYLVIYRGETPPIEILRVLSSYRDIAAILE